MNTHLIVAVLSIVISASATWKLQKISHERDIIVMQSEHTKELTTIRDLADTQFREMVGNHEKVMRNTADRQKKLSVDAAASSNALMLLSIAAEEAILASRESVDACYATADTFRIVFGQCAKEYEQLGKDAQGHVIDKQALIESLSFMSKQYE